MNAFVNYIRRVHRNEEGVTAIEYGLLAALIAIAMIGGAQAVGTALQQNFTNVSTHVNPAAAH